MDRDKLIELAERCEAATDIETDSLLERAFRLVNPRPSDMANDSAWAASWRSFDAKTEANAYESAAMMLVPSHALNAWSLIGSDSPGRLVPWQAEVCDNLADAATPALALCAAALRALAERQSDD